MTKAKRPSLFAVLDSVQTESLCAVDKLILVYLAWRQGTNDAAWPSLKTIEDDLHIDRRTLRRSIARLCETGCIQKTSGRCGRGHSNQYVILPDKRGQVGTRKGGKARPLKVKEVTRRRRAAAPTTFTPPTVDEVRAYADSRGNPDFEADTFVDYYTRTGWKRKNDMPVLDWKATVREWMKRNDARRIERGEPPRDGYSQYGTREASPEEAEAALRDN